MIEIIAMDIQFRLIDSPSPLFERIDALNTSAFPEYERMDSRKLLKMSADSALELLAVMDGEEFVGFTVIFCPADLCYVFFLAIDPSLRGRSYGSAVLDSLRERYPGKQLVLDIEPLDEDCDNPEQRLRRRQFYLRCGFLSSHYLFCYCGLSFEVMYDPVRRFDALEYLNLLKAIKLLVSSYGYEGFNPVLKRITF